MTTLFNRSGVERKPNSKDEKDNPLFKSKQHCTRCGGAGGADKWGQQGTNTGWTCWRCGGSTIDPNPLIEKLYEADKLAKLNEAQAKRDATRAAKAKAAAEAEAERVVREKADVRAAHKPLLDRMKALVCEEKLSDTEGFLGSMWAQVTVKARALSEKQTEALTASLDRIEAENARKTRADFVGVVGEKVELVLHFRKIISLGDQFRPFYIVLFRTDDGSEVVYKGGSPHACGIETVWNEADRSWEWPKESTVHLKATVKAHEYNERFNEPQTLIQRPKVIDQKKEAA